MPATRRLTIYRSIVAAFFAYLGICELLTTSDVLDWDAMPQWLAFPIAVTGFFGVIGLASFMGNGLVAIGILLIIWRKWHWPFWRAALLAMPFWIVTYRLSPKPW